MTPERFDRLPFGVVNAGQNEVRDGPLVIRQAHDERGRVIALAGELDLSNSETLAAELFAAEGAGAPVTLDLGELEFIDSTGIALLVSTHRRLNGDGDDRFRLIESRAASVRQVLELTGVDSALPFVGAA